MNLTVLLISDTSPLSPHRPAKRSSSSPISGSPLLASPRHRSRPHTADANDTPKLLTRHKRVGSDQPLSSYSRQSSSFANSETEGSVQHLTEAREEVGFREQIGASLHHPLWNFPATYAPEPAATTAESRGSKKQRSLEERDVSTPTSLELTSRSENDFLFTSPDTSKERYELGKYALDTVKHIMDVATGSPNLNSLSGSLNSVRSSVYSSKHDHNSSRASSVLHTPLTGSFRMKPQSFDTKGAHTPTNGRQLQHRSSVPTSVRKYHTLPRNYSTPTWSTTDTAGSEEDDQILSDPTCSATSSSATAAGGKPNEEDSHHSPDREAMEQKESSKGTLTEETDTDTKTTKEPESEAAVSKKASLQEDVSSYTGIFIEL